MLLSLGLIVFLLTIVAIIKQYNTTLVLFFSGMILWSLSIAFDAPPHDLGDFKPSGSKIIDIFAVFTSMLESNLAGVGLIIMTVGGFAKYMETIGASNTFVHYVAKPLRFIKNPYFLIVISIIFIQIMSLFIPSASGLGMLLLVTLYPVLRNLGVSKASATAVLASSVCLEIGPASGSTSLAAELSNVSTMTYFIDYQLPVGLITLLTITILYYFTSMYFDKKENAHAEHNIDQANIITSQDETKKPPAIYALLPALPLIFLLVFSDYIISGVELDVATSMIISLIIGIILECIRTRDIKVSLNNATSFFAGMSDMLKNVVMLLVAAQFFAKGLESVGITDYLLQTSTSLGLHATAMTIVLVGLVGFLSLVSGSTNGAFLAFANLAPSVAHAMNVSVQSILNPMLSAAALFRAMSPVSGLIIAVSGGAGISPFVIIKRTAIPMSGGIIVNIIMSHLML